MYVCVYNAVMGNLRPSLDATALRLIFKNYENVPVAFNQL